MPDHTFHLVSLGCAKNTVDSESMAQLLMRDGYEAVDHASRAKIRDPGSPRLPEQEFPFQG